MGKGKLQNNPSLISQCSCSFSLSLITCGHIIDPRDKINQKLITGMIHIRLYNEIKLQYHFEYFKTSNITFKHMPKYRGVKWHYLIRLSKEKIAVIKICKLYNILIIEYAIWKKVPYSQRNWALVVILRTFIRIISFNIIIKYFKKWIITH